LNIIEEIFKILFNKYGPQHWWPAESPFEVIVGAILTQATNWKNVEKAIENIKRKNLLDPIQIYHLSENELALLIKPSGFYKIKTKRLKNFVQVFVDKFKGDLTYMNSLPTNYLRKEFLKIEGLGKETVDSILLYALNRPVFVIDNYTKKIFYCLGLSDLKSSYDVLQDIFHNSLFPIYQLYQEYHALIVEHGKRTCKNCSGTCFLKKYLLYTMNFYERTYKSL